MNTNVIPCSEAARRKDCSTQTIYNAIDRNELTEADFEGSRSRLVVVNEQFDRWHPKETGRRVQRSRS
jgi:hypothetical protein